jgi:hypothetical protein
MAAFTSQELKARLALYVAAEAAILGGQSYQLGERRLQRADLAEVTAEIRRLASEVSRAESSANGARGRLRYGMPG